MVAPSGYLRRNPRPSTALLQSHLPWKSKSCRTEMRGRDIQAGCDSRGRFSGEDGKLSPRGFAAGSGGSLHERRFSASTGTLLTMASNPISAQPAAAAEPSCRSPSPCRSLGPPFFSSSPSSLPTKIAPPFFLFAPIYLQFCALSAFATSTRPSPASWASVPPPGIASSARRVPRSCIPSARFAPARAKRFRRPATCSSTSEPSAWTSASNSRCRSWRAWETPSPRPTKSTVSVTWTIAICSALWTAPKIRAAVQRRTPSSSATKTRPSRVELRHRPKISSQS